MNETVITQAIEKMEKDSIFMVQQIFKNRNISLFIRDILKQSIIIHHSTFASLYEMRILFNRRNSMLLEIESITIGTGDKNDN